MKKWTKSISTGVEKIDEQHRGLFDILEDIYSDIITADDESEHKLLLKLVIYTQDHFNDEEDEMMKYENAHQDLKHMI